MNRISTGQISMVVSQFGTSLFSFHPIFPLAIISCVGSTLGFTRLAHMDRLSSTSAVHN
ncbi:hypothetical protein BDV36DRAFT_248661 [Aspergillus pseudocaelatus]|uniref:Uncharacterized protein n=1 Tax=Aspergillus pseudocaelatus TaxID=1825620 RepID=A0ABQ6WZ92_9EURO|nr:hypothetical protein BDV36DRAFT_248661 [Aspergillus pseudocaelatus]